MSETERCLASNKSGEDGDDPIVNAVTFGRYNTTTIAHIHTIEEIASSYGHVSIGVIDGSLASRPEEFPDEFIEFYNLADLQHEKTTLSIEERRRLLELSIVDKGLSEVDVVKIARPEYAVAEFNKTFPPASYQVVFPIPEGGQAAEFDSLRDVSLQRILGRTTLLMMVNLTVHTSDIRTETSGNPKGWKEYMTPTAYEYFREIDGPERINP